MLDAAAYRAGFSVPDRLHAERLSFPNLRGALVGSAR